MSAAIIILIILAILLIAAGVGVTIYFLTKKKTVKPPVQPPGNNNNNNGSFTRQTGVCIGTTGSKWNIGGRSDADCSQACLTNSATNSTPPSGWTKCTGWDQIFNEGAFSCILYDYADIRGSGDGSSFCEVLTN